jgi:oligosaccharide repeat unit polymerase
MLMGNSFVYLTLLILISVYGYQTLIKKTRSIDLLDPVTSFIIFFTLFILNQIVLTGFRYSIYSGAVILIGTICYLIGTYTKINVKKKKGQLLRQKKISTSKIIYSTIIFSAINFIILLVKIKSYGLGLSEYLIQMLAFHAKYGKMGGYIWLGLSLPVKYLFFKNLLLYNGYEPKPSKILISIPLLLIFSLSGLSASRWGLISSVILFPLLIYQITYLKKGLFKAYFIPIGLFIFPLMIFLNIARQDGFENAQAYIKKNSVSSVALESLSGDTNPGRNLEDLTDYLSKTSDYHYGKYLASQFLFFIPRKIWQDKPITSFNFAYTLKVKKEDPIIDQTTYTFTVFDFVSISGLSSVIIFMFLFGRFSATLYKILYTNIEEINPYIKVFSMLFIVNYINYLRGSVLDSIAFILFELIIIQLLTFLDKIFKT